MQEITDKDVLATGARPGRPKFQKEREELILTKLDARPKKVPPPEVQPPAAAMFAMGRQSRKCTERTSMAIPVPEAFANVWPLASYYAHV